QDDLVLARRLVGVFVAGVRTGRHRGDVLAVAADLPLQATAPVVADRSANHLAAIKPDLGFGSAFKYLVHLLSPTCRLGRGARFQSCLPSARLESCPTSQAAFNG